MAAGRAAAEGGGGSGGGSNAAFELVLSVKMAAIKEI